MSAKQLVFFLAASFSAVAGPVTIVSVLGGIDGSEITDSATYVSWTQTGTYTGVTVQAELYEQVDPDATGVAYLTNQLGPGTTQLSNGQATPFNIDITNTSPALVTLFSGLTLGPGTYYLVINPTDSELAWQGYTTSPTVTTAGGVTLGSNAVCFTSGVTPPCTQPSYPPASNFSCQFCSKDPASFLYQVTGTLQSSGVPEPATAGLMLAALGVGALLLRKPKGFQECGAVPPDRSQSSPVASPRRPSI
jgi:hypothetical protein